MTIPSDEQQQRAKWDRLLLDIEHRTEQVRQLKSYEPWRVIFAGPPARRSSPPASLWGTG